MSNIEEVTSGSVAKNNKLNEVIRAINALQTMTVRQGSDSESPKLIIADRGNVLITTGGGGSDISQSTLFVDYVTIDNEADFAEFYIKP